MRNMGLKVIDRDGNEVLILGFVEDEDDNHNTKKQTKGIRELRNLVWDTNDGNDLKGLE